MSRFLRLVTSVVICLKSLTFVVSITTYYIFLHFMKSCDLLEKSYLCGINNNKQYVVSLLNNVVICLKSLTFVVSITTSISSVLSLLGCDLLEKSYLCGINNNNTTTNRSSSSVVICLKSLTFVVSITTRHKLISRRRLLWFAWKVLPLWYQ